MRDIGRCGTFAVIVARVAVGVVGVVEVGRDSQEEVGG